VNRAFIIWAGALLLVAIVVVACVTWIDMSVAFWVHDEFGGRHVGEGVARLPVLSIPLVSAAIFVLFGLLALAGRQFSRLEITILSCDIGLLVTELIKDQLKFVFGRTWPDSWAPNISSLIRDNQYGFHFFHGGQSFQSFPSGHAAAVAAVMSVLWMQLPAFRPIYVLCIAATGLGLVLLNLHFVSDALAGTFVGFSVGLFTLAILSRLPHLRTDERKSKYRAGAER
jgi:membrane-associated phospholipid phosphatase